MHHRATKALAIVTAARWIESASSSTPRSPLASWPNHQYPCCGRANCMPGKLLSQTCRRHSNPDPNWEGALGVSGRDLRCSHHAACACVTAEERNSLRLRSPPADRDVAIIGQLPAADFPLGNEFKPMADLCQTARLEHLRRSDQRGTCSTDPSDGPLSSSLRRSRRQHLRDARPRARRGRRCHRGSPPPQRAEHRGRL